MLKRIHKARDAGAIKRFHTVRLAQPESVAEHSFNLVNLLLIMTGGCASKELLICALSHDLGESAVGDMPSPIKRALPPEVGWEMDKKELEAIRYLHPYYVGLSVEEAFLLSLCDKLDGLLKCTEELRMGNRYVIEAGNNYCEYVCDMVLDKPGIPREMSIEIVMEYQTEVCK